MSAFVNVNGVITDAAHAVIPVYDHGFLYGEGVYEVFRAYHGVPFLFDRHQARLRESAARIHLDVPFTDAEIEGRGPVHGRRSFLHQHDSGDRADREGW